MQECLHVFLISSPLQAFVADLILTNDASLDRRRSVFFVEDARFADFFDDVMCIPIADTRLAGQDKIAKNLAAILGHLDGSVTLWVSDILWPMNNAVYTALMRQRQLQQVNFFDEGMVLYWQERLSLFSRLRERGKFAVLEHRLNTRFTTPAGRPFYDNRANGLVYALHPHLLSPEANVQPLRIDLARVARLSVKLETAANQAHTSAEILAEGSALVLSQPYYRVADAGEFKAMVTGLARLLRQRGHERLYLKLHPSEGTDLFDRFYRDDGFQIAFSGMKSPVEAILQDLPDSCILASFNSSALFNARKFGFKGQILSYGLNWVAAQYPMQRNLARRNQSLFLQANLEVVLT
jgi:Alpha-2,8-polysialyltransferase (POLYST)